MIVDAHRHLWSIFERYPQAAAQEARAGHATGKVEKLPIVPDWKETGREMIAEMDEGGVDKSVILLGDYALRLGDGVFTPEAENRIHGELMRTYSDRLIAYFGIDPRRLGSADVFQRAVNEWGAKGLKMHPAVGYYPYDRTAYPLYDICTAHDLPVTFHTGPMHSPMFSRYTQPVQFDEVAANFPDMTVILAHAGQDSWPEALNMARMYPNIYLELSMWQRKVKYMDEFVYALDKIRNVIGIERILWATDFPGLRNLMSMRDWIQAFTDLPQVAKKHGASFTEKDADAILGGNAARLLKLT